MWNKKIKRDKADILFSKFIRQRANWCCEYCGKYFPEDKRRGLHASHFYGRRREGTRFDPDNVHSLCAYHHDLLGGEERVEYRDWVLKKLGEKRFNLLTFRANTPTKKDRDMSYLYVKKLMEDLEKEQAKQKENRQPTSISSQNQNGETESSTTKLHTTTKKVSKRNRHDGAKLVIKRKNGSDKSSRKDKKSKPDLPNTGKNKNDRKRDIKTFKRVSIKDCKVHRLA